MSEQTRTLIATARGVSSAGLQINPFKQYVLVSGLFYPDDHNNYKLSGSFNEYAKKYSKKIIKARNKEDIIIIDVNILEGLVKRTEYIGNNPAKESITTFDKVLEINYKKLTNRFLNEGKKIISKTDIYKLVEEIGVNMPNTLEELNVFSHAYWNGPILVNTVEDKPDDHDMRRNDIILGLIDSKKFKNAFTSTGMIKIWGCSFPTSTNALFSKFRNNKSYSPIKTIPDSTKFTFQPDTFWYYPEGEKPKDLITQINNVLRTTYKVTDLIELTFLQIKKILIRNYLDVYAGVMAADFGIKVQSALPATYAEITPDFHIAPSTLANVTLYKKHLDVQLGESNYGIYDTATVKKLIAIYNS
jgi:hypothetical protein